MPRFEGVVPPVTTPFSEDGRILHESLQRNLQRYGRTRLSGFLLLGSNGESVHLNLRERVELIEKAVPAVPPGKQLIIGLSSAAEVEALEFLDAVSNHPIDAVLVGAPSYYKNRMNRAALSRFFTTAADRSPFPTLLYNVPQYSGLEIPPALAGELADHPNIIGMKDSSGNLSYLQRLLEAAAGKDFEILVGSAQILGPSLTLGIRAAILAVACAYPEMPIRLMDEFFEGRSIRDRARELFAVANAVTDLFGVAGLKYAMDLAGYEGGFCRRPLLPLTAEEKTTIDGMLKRAAPQPG